MKKLLSLILAITMIAAFIPTAFAADGDATTVTYTFTQAGKGASVDWMEKINKTNNGTIATAFKDQTFSTEYATTENEYPNKRWAYLGTNVKSAASQAKKGSDIPVMLYTGNKCFLRTLATEANDWVALKIKAPADGMYKVSAVTAFCQSNASSDIGVYIMPMDLTVATDDGFNGKTLSEVFARGSSVYGNFTIDASTGYSVRNNAKKFTELGISSEDQAKYKAASVNANKSLSSSAAVSDAATVSENSQTIELDADKEYILLFCNTVNNKTINIESLTLTADPTAEEPEENAPVELTEDVNFASGASIKYKIGDGEYKSLSANDVKRIPVGTKITVKLNDVDNFAGWVRGTVNSKNWISDEHEYTFIIMSHTYLTPVYTETKATNAEQVVEFWNENKEYLGTSDVMEGKATAPAATLTGHTFSTWHISEEEILPLENGSVNVSGIADAIIRAVAKHSAVNGFGTTIPNSNSSATYWLRGEDIVAYGNTYNFYKWSGDETITYGTKTIENKPLVVLDTTSVDGAYMIEYDKGNAKEVVEAGILFGSDDDIVIGSTDGSKAASQRNSDHGQFCAKPNGSEAYARGYLIYRVADDKLYVIYTDAVATTSAQ